MTTFDLTAQDEHVQRHGDRVAWRQGFKCACGPKADPNRANPNCLVCHGTGYRYGDPVEIVGLVLGIHHERQLVEAGIAQPGDMVLSLSPFERQPIGDFDMIRLTWDDGSPYDGDLIVRGTGVSDQASYDIKRVLEVATVNSGSGAITRYTENSSFVVAGRAITWLASQPQPEPGQVYSIKYTVQSFDWIAFVSPMQRFEQGSSLGQKVLLRKRHLVTRQ